MFLTKLSEDGSVLLYSAYIGGDGDDYGHGVAVDVSGSAYVAGHTSSTEFPTTHGVHTPADPPGVDAFVVKVSTGDAILVTVDVLRDTVRPSSDQQVPVAVITTAGFDAVTVDARSVCFGDAEAPAERLHRGARHGTRTTWTATAIATCCSITRRTDRHRRGRLAGLPGGDDDGRRSGDRLRLDPYEIGW